MGVQLGSSGSSGGRRNVDSELNLIPFIDLLSVCILFLLMTAVWVEIAKMSAFSQGSSEVLVRHSDVSSLSDKKSTRDLELFVRNSGIEVRKNSRSIGVFQLDQLTDILINQAKTFSDPVNAQVTLLAADDVLYDQVMMALDALYSANFLKVNIGGLS
ncbi:MAG: biopolymer transporter ExbD [Bdellovibrionota bacterium]